MDNSNPCDLDDVTLSNEELTVPAEFEKRGDQDLDEVRSGDKVLNVAYGTDILSIATKQCGIDTDINFSVSPIVGSVFTDEKWREGKGGELPWNDHFFDTVICQFGPIYIENQQAELQEIFRVLKPRGRIVIVVFDTFDSIPQYYFMMEALNSTVGAREAQAPRFFLNYLEQLEILCSEKGFMQVQIITQRAKANFPDLETMVLPDVKGLFSHVGIQPNDKQIRKIISEAEITLSEFIREDGSVLFPLPVHFIIYENI